MLPSELYDQVASAHAEPGTTVLAARAAGLDGRINPEVLTVIIFWPRTWNAYITADGTIGFVPPERSHLTGPAVGLEDEHGKTR